MGRKNKNKSVTPTETGSAVNETIVNSPVVVTQVIKESDLDLTSDLKEEGIKVGDKVKFDEASEIHHTSDGEFNSRYINIWNFYQKNDLNVVPVNFLMNFNLQFGTFNGIETDPYNYFESVGRDVNYCRVNADDISYELKTRTDILLCIPSTYDIIKEGDAIVAVFSESGKLNFRDIFNFETMSLMTGL